MRKKIRFWFINLLTKVNTKLYKGINAEEYQARKDKVMNFMLEKLPEAHESFQKRTFCVNGAWNCFQMPDGSLPKFDLVYPEIPLYICVFGPESASWEEARLRGIPRWEWERCQENIACLKLSLPGLTTLQSTRDVRFLLITWEQPIMDVSLLEQLKSLNLL